VRTKTRRQTITPDGPPGLLCQSCPGRRDTTFFFLNRHFSTAFIWPR